MTSTETPVRRLAYRYFTEPPFGDLDRVEWMIETQLSLAHDYGEPNLRAVLLCFRPELDETVGHRLDELLDLADDVARAESWPYGTHYYAAVDAYKDALYQLAVLLRGGRS